MKLTDFKILTESCSDDMLKYIKHKSIWKTLYSYNPRYILNARSHYLSFLYDVCACTTCASLNATVLVYILGTHYQENQCMTLLYSGRLLINLRTSFYLLSFLAEHRDQNIWTQTQTHKSINSVYTEGTIILTSMIKHSWKCVKALFECVCGVCLC